MKRYLCVIPARGGSRRIPNKNIKPLGGKPLIAWTVEYALRCARLDRVIVSTDDEAIAQVARQYGAEVPFMRPPELATNDARTEVVLLHALDALGTAEDYVPDVVVMMQATSPFRRPGRLEQAIALYEQKGADSLFTAVPQAPFLWRGSIDPQPLYDIAHRPFTHAMTPDQQILIETGSIYLTDTTVLRRSQNRLGARPAMLIQTGEECFDIDTPEEFTMAELMLVAGLRPEAG